LIIVGLSTNFAQTLTRIKGKVIDAKSGETLPFVNVSVLGTKQGTQTDMNGSLFNSRSLHGNEFWYRKYF
jgi:hypothetical protein